MRKYKDSKTWCVPKEKLKARKALEDALYVSRKEAGTKDCGFRSFFNITAKGRLSCWCGM